MPDLTTRAKREAMDSEDFAALDFLVGAIGGGEAGNVGVGGLEAAETESARTRRYTRMAARQLQR